MTQVLLNLLSNAAKFVPAHRCGQVAVRLMTAAPEGPDAWRCRDNGPGVPAGTTGR